MIRMLNGLGFLLVAGTVIAASVLMVLLGLVYFVINLWIVKFGSGLMGFSPDSNWAVGAAALLTVAGLVGSSSVRKMF